MRSLSKWLDTNQITQRQFANEIGVHETAISQWLSGGTKPTLDNLRKIADRTRIPVEALLADLTSEARTTQFAAIAPSQL